MQQLDGHGRRRMMTAGAGALMASGALAASGPAASPGGNPGGSPSSILARTRPHMSDVQVIFVDLQPELIAGSTTVTPNALSTAAGVLAKGAKALGLPMTFCVVPVTGQAGRLTPELAEQATSSNTFSRTTTSPFLAPRIAQALQEKGRKVLVVAGFSAEVAVLQTALDGLAAGYEVVVPIDAIGSRSDRTESAAIRQIELGGGITTSVLSLLTRLAPDISSGSGAEVFKALGALRSTQ